MVEHPKLKQHLQHFGIRVVDLQKTDKTVAELTLELTLRAEASSIQEEGRRLVPVTGPGFMGLRNLGNSCYINSTMQILYSLPEWQIRLMGDVIKQPYDLKHSLSRHVEKAGPNPPTHLITQLRKLGFGLLSGRYGKLVFAITTNAVQVDPFVEK